MENIKIKPSSKGKENAIKLIISSVGETSVTAVDVYSKKHEATRLKKADAKEYKVGKVYFFEKV